MSKLKVFIIVILVVAGGFAGALLGLNGYARTQITSQAEGKLAGAEISLLNNLRVKAFEAIVNLSRESRDERLAAPLEGLIPLAPDSAAEAVASTLKGAHDAILPALEAGHKKAGLESLAVLSGEGWVVARAPDKNKFGQNLRGLPAVAECLAGVTRDGLYELDGKITRVAAAPLHNPQGKVVGCLFGQDTLDAETLKGLLGVSGLEAAIFLRKKPNLSTMNPNLLGPLVQKLGDKNVIWFGEPTESALFLDLGGMGYAARTVAIPGGTDEMDLAVVLAVGPSIAPASKAQTTLLLATVAILVIGLLLGWFLTGKTESVEALRLRDALKMLADGTSSSINTDGYSGVYAELAQNISELNITTTRPAPAATSSFANTLGVSAEPLVKADKPIAPAPADSAMMEFESLLSGETKGTSSPAPEEPQRLPAPEESIPSPPSPRVAPLAPEEAADPFAMLEDEPPRAAPAPFQPQPRPGAAAAGPKIELPGDLAGIFDEPEKTREVEPAITAQARTAPSSSRKGFAMPSIPPPPATPSSPPIDFDAPALDDLAGEDQISSSDYRPDATVIAEVPDELLRASANIEFGEPHGTASIPPPPVSSALPKPPTFAPNPPAVAFKPQAAAMTGEEAHFHEVFDQFVGTKKQCGESTVGLTFDKFAEKLRRNTAELKSKFKCKSVKFQVYVKNGKAALKATPITK